MKDFLRAGIARRVDVLDSKGKPVIIKNRLGQRVKTRIVVEDQEGRVIDLHAMRTTLGTNLARAGVAPQIAQRIMRHGDYKTTLKHYTVLGLADTSAAVSRLPSISIPGRNAIAATGTDGKSQNQPQLYSQQLGREVGKSGAIQRDDEWQKQAACKSEKTRKSPGNTRETASDLRKRAKGFEPSTFSLEGCQPSVERPRKVGDSEASFVSPSYSPSSSKSDQKVLDPDLQVVVDSWENLPLVIRQAIVTLSRSVLSE